MSKVYVVECPEFNDFLGMFEEEELKEETCSICGGSVLVRDSYTGDEYICADCGDKIIKNHMEHSNNIIKIEKGIPRCAMLEAIRQYKHWLEEANMTTDEEEETEGYYDALEDIEEQLNETTKSSSKTQFQLLKQIAKDWERDFKGDLLSGMLDYTDILAFIDAIIDEWMPVWNKENSDNAEAYDKYKVRLENLNWTELSKEYQEFREMLTLFNS